MNHELAYRHLYQLQQKPERTCSEERLIQTIYEQLAPQYNLVSDDDTSVAQQLRLLVNALAIQFPSVDHNDSYTGALDCRMQSHMPYSIEDICSQTIFFVRHPHSSNDHVENQSQRSATCQIV